MERSGAVDVHSGTLVVHFDLHLEHRAGAIKLALTPIKSGESIIGESWPTCFVKREGK